MSFRTLSGRTTRVFNSSGYGTCRCVIAHDPWEWRSHECTVAYKIVDTPLDAHSGSPRPTRSDKQRIEIAWAKLGIPLYSFSSSKILVTAIRDALLAHRYAFERCTILHGNISAGNILITPDEKGGFLNDWDLVADMQNGARQRSGTWPYMAAYLLSMPEKMQTLQDDLESFFWVLLYIVMRYTANVRGRRDTVDTIFFQHGTRDGQCCGGDGKIAFINNSLTCLELSNNAALNDLVWDFRGIIRESHNFMSRMNEDAGQILRSNKNIVVADAIQTALLGLSKDSDILDNRNYDRIQTIFEQSLQRNTWPENDKAYDYFSETTRTKRELVKDDHETSTEGSTPKKSRLNDRML